MIKKVLLSLAFISAPIAYSMDATNAVPGMTVTQMKVRLESKKLWIQSITSCLNSTELKIRSWARQEYEEALPGLEKQRDLLQLQIWEREQPDNDLDRGMMVLLKKVHSK